MMSTAVSLSVYFPSWRQQLFLYQCTSLLDIKICFSISVLPFMTSTAVSLSVSFPSWRQQLFLCQCPSLHDVNSCFSINILPFMTSTAVFADQYPSLYDVSSCFAVHLVSHCPTHLYCSPLWCRIVQLTCIARLFGVALSNSPVLLASLVSHCPTHLYCSPLWCRIVQLTCIASLASITLGAKTRATFARGLTSRSGQREAVRQTVTIVTQILEL